MTTGIFINDFANISGFLNSYNLFTNLTQFKSSHHTKKIAILETTTYPISRDIDQLLPDLLEICDDIIIMLTEMHVESIELSLTCRDPKIKLFASGCVNGCNNQYFMRWFINLVNFYSNNIGILDRLNPYDVKPYTFDILLGHVKPHRTLIYEYINQKNYNDKVIMTFFHEYLETKLHDPLCWIQEDGVMWIPNEPFYGIATQVNYYNNRITVANVIPISVYNQTAYSIVAETFAEGDYNLFTEKVGKPILAKRLFIVYSSPYYLQNLRKLGFKTFDGIIDESYDLELDFIKRGQMVMEQIEYLIHQPQEEILFRIKDITEHNKKLMLETNWLKDIIDTVALLVK